MSLDINGSAAGDVSWPVQYRVDIEDRLAEFNGGWLDFAMANGGEALYPSRILGQSLWRFLTDGTTRHLYHVMVQRLRAGRAPIRFQLRCDAPDRRRLLAMEMTADEAGSVQFSVTSVLEESRRPVSLLKPPTVRGEYFLTMCSWCKKIQTPAGRWVEAEEAVDVLGLFVESPLPELTHGMCPPCYAAILATLGGPGAGTSDSVAGAGARDVS